jgi:hypothetical protein
MRKKLLGTVVVLALAMLGVAGSAFADTNHGRPAVCSQAAGQIDEAGFGTRDGFDHFHVTNAAVFASLADLEGFLNTCRTIDANVAENVSASARAIRVSGVNRVQLRAQLNRFEPITAGWELVSSSDSVNTGDNRTLTVTTPLSTEATAAPATFRPGWYYVNIRALVRYANSSLVFYQRQTYPVWLGDGPAFPATPPPT